MEKSNTYLENVLATLDEATDSRIFQIINDGRGITRMGLRS